MKEKLDSLEKKKVPRNLPRPVESERGTAVLTDIQAGIDYAKKYYHKANHECGLRFANKPYPYFGDNLCKYPKISGGGGIFFFSYLCIRFC